MFQSTLFDDSDILPRAESSLEELLETYEIVQGAPSDPVTLIRREVLAFTPPWLRRRALANDFSGAI
jgi:hypothetical protein